MKVLRPVLVVLLAGALFALVPETAHADPAVTSVSPSGGVNTGPTQLTAIEGSGFLPGARISLVDLHPVTGAVEQTLVATSHGAVSSDGKRITGVDFDTLGLAPSSKEPPQSPSDVSWFVRVTNLDGKASTSAEFRILGDTPTLTTPSETPELPRGATTTLVVHGSNLARGATFTIDSGDPPQQPPASDVDYRLSVVSATWKSLDTYELQVKVPKGANKGERKLTITNTDGKAVSCDKCMKVVDGIATATPIVSKISVTQASNSDANNKLAVKITGEDFNDKSTIEAALVGWCHSADPCPMGARRVPLTIDLVRDADPAKQELNPLEQMIEGKFDLSMQAPGRYSVEVVNKGGDPEGKADKRGVLANAFEIFGSPPVVKSPTSAAPLNLDAAATQPTAIEVGGEHFAKGDIVRITDATVTDVVVHSRSRITALAKAKPTAATGLRELVVEHANGARATCSGCVHIKAAPPAKSATDRYIEAVHQLFLKRPPTSAELTKWRSTVNAGNRLTLTRELATSDTFAGTQIDLLYRTILGRASDSGGRAYWLDQVRRGTRLDQIASYFYGGPEFFKKSGSTNRGYVDALYRQILGRTADESGRRYWVEQLDSGRLDRSGVASNFYAGIESRRQRAHRQYALVFGVAPTPTVRETLAGRIGSVGDIVVAAELAASREYYDKVTTT